MKKKIYTIILLLFSSGLFAQGVYNNGGKIVIGSGVYVNISGAGGNYRNESNGTNGSIDLYGKLKLDGNFTNNVIASDIVSVAGIGSEILFTGTIQQNIGGLTTTPFVFNNLTVNNINGLAFSNPVTVNGIMTLTNGITTLGANDLILGSAASFAGTPSATAMIVAEGAGQVKKQFSTTGSFTFPVGDNSNIAEYSPVTLNFTSGTFATVAYAGVNLKNAAYPDPFITNSYLNRYWNVTQTGITGFTCDASFNYQTADVVGVENNIYCIGINPLPVALYNATNIISSQLTANGLTSFGAFTGALGFRNLNLTSVLFEGLYNGAGTMRQAANGVGGVNSNPLIADQITVELHNALYSSIAYTAANVNLSTAGTAMITVPAVNNGSYYITIRHRNHIETTTISPVSFSGSTINYAYDLPSKVYGSNLKLMTGSGSYYAIYGGDVIPNGIVESSDMTPVDNMSAVFGYDFTFDVNSDGFIDSQDMTIVDNNNSGFVTSYHP